MLLSHLISSHDNKMRIRVCIRNDDGQFIIVKTARCYLFMYKLVKSCPLLNALRISVCVRNHARKEKKYHNLLLNNKKIRPQKMKIIQHK